MISTAIAPHDSSAVSPIRPGKLAIAAAIAALADWLFYGHALGISLVLFLLALCIGAMLTNPVYATRRALLNGAVVFLLAIAPLIVETSLIGLAFAATGAAYAALIVTHTGATWTERLIGAVALLLDGFWRIFPDLSCGIGQWLRSERATDSGRALIVWIVPLVLGVIFLTLFSSANPLIENWFTHIDLRFLLERISVSRVAFWIALLALTWPFIFIRFRAQLEEKVEKELRSVAAELPAGSSLSAQLFGKDAILRSLILFNLLFAVQTLLDTAYLWGGVALPEGMSYASYAHRGAYPLVVTALLAAVFVILATRPGSEAERSFLIRNLVFLWIAQNVLLVISSILRLDLYVDVYSLTYWRVAAFVWMLLVAIGLVLIVLRIISGRSNVWLVGMNLSSLAVALYVCAFINFPRLIANYNVWHSKAATGNGRILDVHYLMSLGAHAIPAFDSYVAIVGSTLNKDPVWNEAYANITQNWHKRRNMLAAAHLNRMNDWRAWTYQDWRLARYLQSKANGASAKQ
ncbi:MAG: DUF4173 domain-containing protein [Pseudorhodoplanes sp.]|nr:DUF4173 domain-containing protein [Pseudorhodoplanes sp.]